MGVVMRCVVRDEYWSDMLWGCEETRVGAADVFL